MCIGRKVTDLDSLKGFNSHKESHSTFPSPTTYISITEVSNTEIPHKRITGETV
jgi:hypothetical protein